MTHGNGGSVDNRTSMVLLEIAAMKTRLVSIVLAAPTLPHPEYIWAAVSDVAAAVLTQSMQAAKDLGVTISEAPHGSPGASIGERVQLTDGTMGVVLFLLPGSFIVQVDPGPAILVCDERYAASVHPTFECGDGAHDGRGAVIQCFLRKAHHGPHLYKPRPGPAREREAR